LFKGGAEREQEGDAKNDSDSGGESEAFRAKIPQTPGGVDELMSRPQFNSEGARKEVARGYNGLKRR